MDLLRPSINRTVFLSLILQSTFSRSTQQYGNTVAEKIKCDSTQWMQLPYLLFFQQWHSTLWNDEWTLSCFPPTRSVPGARREPHSSPAQPVRGPSSVHGGRPGRISGRAAPHHAGRRPAQAAQQWQLLRGRAAIQAGATDGSSQHGEEGRTGRRDEWRQGGGERDGLKESIMNGHSQRYNWMAECLKNVIW